MRTRATRLFAISGGGRRGQSVFAGAAAAYAVRLPANSTYYGPLIRVRRSNDNAEQDIYPVATPDTNGNRFIDTTALLAFTGANNGFVTTDYDVSGNGRHATQTATPKQTRIVNAGVVDTFNGRPAITAGGITGLSTPFNLNGLASWTINFVSSPTTTAGFNSAFRQDGAGAFAVFPFTSNGALSPRDLVSTNSITLVLNYNVAAPVVHTMVREAGVSNTAFLNGSSVASSAADTQAYPNALGATLMNNFGYTEPFIGQVAEYVFFTSAISDTQRQALEQNQGTAYGITVA